MATQDTWCANTYNKTASFVYSQAFTVSVLSLLDAQPGEHIIDFGCGSGELCLELYKAVGPRGLVVGVDASEDMVKTARANGLAHCIVSDIQDLRFPSSGYNVRQSDFDAVFTNAALHWCKRDPAGVARSAKAVLKPGGRFVGEFGGFTNCIGVRSSIHSVLKSRGYNPEALDPWYFPSTADYKSVLESQGFRVDHISLNPRYTQLTTNIVDWLRLFARKSFLAGIADTEAEAIMQEVEDICSVDSKDESGNWAMMYTRLRFVAVLE